MEGKQKLKKCKGGCGKTEIKEPIQICQVCNRPYRTHEQAGKLAKSKGNSYERKIAKLFSEWWGEVKSFRRTPMSGGWSKSRATGDIICPSEFPFDIECKHHKDWELIQLLKSPEKCKLMKFWKQAVDECRPNKKPMLIFTKNNQPDLVMVCDENMRKIALDNKFYLDPVLVCFLDGDPMAIFLLSKFLSEVKSEWLKTS